MQKPALFRAIYSELRRGLGQEVSSKELLAIASHILRAYADDAPLVDHPDARDSRSFATLPVDRAMDDGGWRVLEYETLGHDVDEPTTRLTVPARAIVEKYLGPEWKNRYRTE